MSAVPRLSSLPRPGRAGASLAGMTVALAATLAACGSTTTSASTTSTTAKTASGTASTAAYTSCLESHGVPSSAASQLASGGRRAFGGGGPGGPESPGSTPSLPAGVTQSSLRTALTACRSENPNRGRFGGGGANFNSAAFAAYRNCLQIHGVTLPTPGAPGSSTTSTTAAGGSTASTTPGGGRGLGGLNTSDPTVQAALQACANLRPARTGGSTTTTVAG